MPHGSQDVTFSTELWLSAVGYHVQWGAVVHARFLIESVHGFESNHRFIFTS